MPAPLFVTCRDMNRARALAREIDAPAMVYGIDSEDDRTTGVGRLNYADDPEFEAFCGEVLVVAYPDGTLE